MGDANRTLPYVRRVVGEIRERYAALRRNGKLHNETPEADSETRGALKEKIRHGAQRIRECQEELAQVGVILKDYDRGLVDFPAELDGKAILMCWEHGEPEVAHWHGPNEGFFGRQEIPADCDEWPRVSPAPASAARE